MEEWKDVPGYEGRYQASTYGRIKSLARVVKINEKQSINRREMILKERKLDYSGKLSKDRPKVVLFIGGKRRDIQVSRIIGFTFLGLNMDNPYDCVLHKDDNPYNNRIENLFTGTYKDNYEDCYSKGRHFNNKN